MILNLAKDSVLVAWQRLVFPDGKALDIGAMSGSDSAGYAGFRDEVDHHYARVYASAILMSGIVAGISYSQNRNQSSASRILARPVSWRCTKSGIRSAIRSNNFPADC